MRVCRTTLFRVTAKAADELANVRVRRQADASPGMQPRWDLARVDDATFNNDLADHVEQQQGVPLGTSRLSRAMSMRDLANPISLVKFQPRMLAGPQGNAKDVHRVAIFVSKALQLQPFFLGRTAESSAGYV